MNDDQFKTITDMYLALQKQNQLNKSTEDLPTAETVQDQKKELERVAAWVDQLRTDTQDLRRIETLFMRVVASGIKMEDFADYLIELYDENLLKSIQDIEDRLRIRESIVREAEISIAALEKRVTELEQVIEQYVLKPKQMNEDIQDYTASIL